MADALAGKAAEQCRLPADVRARVSEVEHTAALARWRLLRSTLDAAAAAGARPSRRGRRPRRAPPAPRVAAVFGARRVLHADGRSCAARRCSAGGALHPYRVALQSLRGVGGS